MLFVIIHLKLFIINNFKINFRLIREEKMNVNQRHPLGWTPLHVAVINDKLENVKVLIAAGADPNAPDEFSNVYNTAVNKRMHAIDGNYSYTVEV